MTKTGFKDLFSQQSSDYARFRPTYPDELFRYLASLPSQKKLAWDCGTGNGQAAVKLSIYFEHVIATDPSEKQLQNVLSHPKIEYRKASAEQSGLAAGSVDLVTVAQAFHWFRHGDFYAEVRRICAPGAVLAVWCYRLAVITPEIDAVVLRFHNDTLGPYWEKERKLVDEGYRNVAFPFKEITVPAFEMSANWSLDHLLGYLGTWSALQAFVKKNASNPLDELTEELKSVWGEAAVRVIRWPLSLRVGNVEIVESCQPSTKPMS